MLSGFIKEMISKHTKGEAGQASLSALLAESQTSLAKSQNVVVEAQAADFRAVSSPV